jgi:hypothetical protein
MSELQVEQGSVSGRMMRARYRMYMHMHTVYLVPFRKRAEFLGSSAGMDFDVGRLNIRMNPFLGFRKAALDTYTYSTKQYNHICKYSTLILEETQSIPRQSLLRPSLSFPRHMFPSFFRAHRTWV